MSIFGIIFGLCVVAALGYFSYILIRDRFNTQKFVKDVTEAATLAEANAKFEMSKLKDDAKNIVLK